MKIKSNFAKRKIADSNIVVPVGPAIKDFNGMITLNDSASFFWDCMINETTEEEVIEKVINEYDIDKETAKRDIEKFIKMKDDTQKDCVAKDKVPQKATINERMEQQKKEEEEMQQIMDLYREWFQKNEITEEEVQEWKRGVSNRKETME